MNFPPIEHQAENDHYLEAMRQAVNAIESCNLTIAEYENYMSRFRRELAGERPIMKRTLCLEWRDTFRCKRLREVKALRAKRQSASLDMVNVP